MTFGQRDALRRIIYKINKIIEGNPSNYEELIENVYDEELGDDIRFNYSMYIILPYVEKLLGTKKVENLRVELQADCYAGLWTNFARRQNYLESGDSEEAINAANAIGDDTLTRGRVSERNFTHGTAEQRMKWLKRGMESGDPAACDTFSGPI